MGEYACTSPSTPLPPVQGRKEQPSPRHHKMVSSSSPKATRPAIRIIHIIAPEIIKTDAANFRDLVQRLTGRDAADDDDSTAVTVGVAPPLPQTLPPLEEKPQKVEAAAVKKRVLPGAPALQAADFVAQQENKRRKKIKCEVVKVEDGAGFGYGGFGELGHGGDLWMDLNPGGFLSFLEEADVFQGMAHPDFLQPLGSSRMDFVGEMCASFLA